MWADARTLKSVTPPPKACCALALSFALLMPKPAQRTVASLERNSLSQACDLVTILLQVDARNRVDLTSLFARTSDIINVVDQANGVDKIDEARMEQARVVAQQVINKIKGKRVPDFAILVDRKGRVSVVTTAGSGPSVGKFLLMAYLPPEHAVVGTELCVNYMNDLYPVKVAVAGSTPLFDPDDARMKS